MSHKCRICNESALPVISYGKMPLANAFLTKDQFAGEYFFELAVAHCPACKMFQLVEQPNPEMMFHGDYAFFSGTSKKMAAHFAAKAESHIKNFLNGKNNPFVVELGSNDGIFLKNFAAKSIRHLGIEPSGNVAAEARKNGVNSLVAFFGKDTAEKVRTEYGAADIISAANVMCHIPDLDSVGCGVDALLALDGIFEFEDPYLGAMIEKTSYDQIYDEHVYIFSAQAVANAFARHGLELFHVEPLQTHGGSMRYYLCRKGAHQVRGSVKEQLIWEEKLGLGRSDTYKAFAGRCRQNREELVSLLKNLKSQGRRVVGYAATSKSTTILNYCGIGPDLISCIYDTTPLKQGKFSPGMHIPVKAFNGFYDDYPDYAVLFAWNHAQEIFEKETDFTAAGHKWILFCPEVKAA